jgi:uncharacterized repeat protein (TIGR02543 family)
MKRILLIILLTIAIFTLDFGSSLNVNAAVGDELTFPDYPSTPFLTTGSVSISETILTINGSVSTDKFGFTDYFINSTPVNYTPGAIYKVDFEYVSGTFTHLSGVRPEFSVLSDTSNTMSRTTLKEFSAENTQSISTYLQTLEGSTKIKISMMWDDAYQAEFSNLKLRVRVTETTVMMNTIWFKSYGGTYVNSKQYIPNTAIGSLPTPTKEGFYFAGWFYESALTNKVNSTDIVTSNRALYPKWSLSPELPEGLTFSWILNPPTFNYKIIDNEIYFTNNNTTLIDLSLISNLEIDSNNLTIISSNPNYHTLTYGSIQHEATIVEIPTGSSGIYLYFYRDGTQTVLQLHSTTIYIPEITEGFYIKLSYDDLSPIIRTVTFNSNGGSLIDPINIESGNNLTLPTTPTKTGFTFAGWYLDNQLLNLFYQSNPIEESITLHAKWSPIVEEDTEVTEDQNSDVLDFLENYWYIVLLFLLGIASLTGKRR